MDELKHLTNKSNVIQIRNILYKITKSIRVACKENIKLNNIKEIDFLKEQCLAENTHLSLLAYQTFVGLCEDGTLDAGAILSMFISMVPSVKFVANSAQYVALSEGIINLLLFDLKRRSGVSSGSSNYRCPFGLKPPQHPIIILFQTKDVNMNDMINKINGICAHHDKDIKNNSIEFLRPVFLHILCNSNVLPDSKSIWSCLLQHSKKSQPAQQLVYEILSWTNILSATSCLNTSMLITEAIEFALNRQQYKTAMELTLYLVALLSDIINWGYDPRPGFHITLKTLQKSMEHISKKLRPYFVNTILLILTDSLYIISPLYMIEMIRLLDYLIVTINYGDLIISNMILEGLIIWVAKPLFINSELLKIGQKLINFIQSKQYESLIGGSTDDGGDDIDDKNNVDTLTIKNYHGKLAFNWNLTKFSLKLSRNILNNNYELLEQFIVYLEQQNQLEFCQQNQLFIRGLSIVVCYRQKELLPKNISVRIIGVLIEIIKTNENISIDMMLPWLYRLSKETESDDQFSLLRGLTAFGHVKENIPIIINTLKSISNGPLATIALDLYLRLWKLQPRTYQYLNNSLLSITTQDSSKIWQINLVKAYTIKEICKLKPEQYGTDLVVHISKILNESSTTNVGDEVITSLALEAIIILCCNHTVNIASTWQALSGKFANEIRCRPVIKLCELFGNVPLFRTTTTINKYDHQYTDKYEELYEEVLKMLWKYITLSNDEQIIIAALKALSNFDFNDLKLSQIPEKFRENLIIPSAYLQQVAQSDVDIDVITLVPYVPGECWLQLIQNINPIGISAASNLVGKYIYREINNYRSVVYTLPENYSEPLNLSRLLSKQSPLKAIVKFLLSQTQQQEDHQQLNMIISTAKNELIIYQCLRALSGKFPKPIPPLNWFFLIDFMNRNVENKFICLRIALKQIVQSESAKNVVENYMLDFNGANCMDPIEIEKCIELLPEIAVGVIGTNIFSMFAEKLFNFIFAQSKSTGFLPNCWFQLGLLRGKDIFTEKLACEENINSFGEIIGTYLVSIDVDDLIFKPYMEICSYLPHTILNSLTSMVNYPKIDNFMKFTEIRCYLAISPNSKTFTDNPLTWIYPILENVIPCKVDPSYVLKKLTNTFHKFDNDKFAKDWLIDILNKIQNLLLGGGSTTSSPLAAAASTSTSKDTDKAYCTFLIDVFTMSIVVLSGLVNLFDELNIIADSLTHRMEYLPESLLSLNRKPTWKEIVIRIYEFLYHIYVTAAIDLPSYFTDAIKQTLILSKHEMQLNMKFIGLRINK